MNMNTLPIQYTISIPKKFYGSRSQARQKKVSIHHSIFHAFHNTKFGQLYLHSPTHEIYQFGNNANGPIADIRLLSWHALDALLARGEVGFAEAYIAGLWDSEDLPTLLTWALINADELERYFYGHPLYALWVRIKAQFHANSLSGSKRNILKHYDVGNNFYALWLDKSMTYSCALFADDCEQSLETAQRAKYMRILSRLDAKPGEHILEIGCGWGGFAEIAASKGLKVTSITISEEQQRYAAERIEKAGLSDRADIKFQDYRESQGSYDYIVSIGMFEHVGEAYWPAYFETIKRCLKPGGKAMVQTITLDDEIFERTRGKQGFIEEYIFPGGFLPSKRRYREAVAHAGLACKDLYAFGGDYALTLKHWLQRFESHLNDIQHMGYSYDFIRMWRFYLAACIGSFQSKRTDVMQTELTHAG